jgi:hypothetical protein
MEASSAGKREYGGKKKKMNQVLGAFGLLDLTVLWPFSLGGRFETYEPFIYLNFHFWGAAVNRGY